MTPIDRLIAADLASPKRILVVGDAMIDEWVTGTQHVGQEDCPCFKQASVVRTPGGAANAARQLRNWQSCASLAAPWPMRLKEFCGNDFDLALYFDCNDIPVKRRFLNQQGHVFFRHDVERPGCGFSLGDSTHCRWLVLETVTELSWDAVLLADYDKGVLDNKTIRAIIKTCRDKGVVIVADAKRNPSVYDGAVLQCNAAYAAKHGEAVPETVVATNGPFSPWVGNAVEPFRGFVQCKNHVGAGDCFAAHLTLALAHGLPLEEAAAIAHAAGRVYVQHLHARPPWPHEIRKDMMGAAGKVLDASCADNLHHSIKDRNVIFANGVFRIPHAGHAWLAQWAKAQGDVLVVGINDDASALNVRCDEQIMPLVERCAMLAALDAVDWVIPFAEDTPAALMEHLKPNFLVKGHEYADSRVPGDGKAEVLIAPESPFPRHASDLVAQFRS